MNRLKNLINKAKNLFYYERVVLYGYVLTEYHEFETNIDYELCKATLQDIEQLYNDENNTDLTSIDWDLWKEKVSGDIWKGFLVKDGKSIVAQAFYSTEDIFFGGTKWVTLNMPESSAYGFKLFARPDYRGKRLGQAVTSFRLNCAKKDEIKKYYTIIYADNKISRHNEEKIGGYLAGSAIFLKCRFFNKVIFTPGIYKEGIRLKKISDF